MSAAITWVDSIQESDLQSVPADMDAPNAVDVSRKTDVVLSGTFDGGTDVSADVAVYFYNKITQTFGNTGVTLQLSEDDNLSIFNPTGLPLGFVVTVHGNPTSFYLEVGSR